MDLAKFVGRQAAEPGNPGMSAARFSYVRAVKCRGRKLR